MSPLRKTVTATFENARGRSTKGNDRTSPIAFTVSVVLFSTYVSALHVGIEDVEGMEVGCSEGINDSAADGFADGFMDGIEDGSLVGLELGIEEGFEEE
jgi:hypothetical protein